MKCFSVILSVVLAVTVAASGQTTRPARGRTPAPAGEPSAAASKRMIALFDTGEPLTLGESTVAAVVDESKAVKLAKGATEAVKGDAVLINDKLAAVVRKDGSGADLYVRGQGGWTRRGRVVPVAGTEELKATGIKVKAIEPSEVSVEVGLGASRGMVFSLAVASPILKATATGKVDCLRIKAPCRFGVQPDFFADDLVMDAQDVTVDDLEIPSENFFLHMLGDGEAILAAVWEKNVKDIKVSLAGEKEAHQIVATDVFFGDEGSQGSVWTAVLEEKGIWHYADVVKEDGLKGKRLEGWAVPFVAKWKGNFTREDGTIASEPFEIQGFGYSGAKFRHKLDSNREKPGTMIAIVQPHPDQKYEKGMKEYVGYRGAMIAYPIGRLEPTEEQRKSGSRGTPVDRLCVDDLLRECLGTEACAYVLDVDARKMNNPGIFTCSYGKTPFSFVPPGPAEYRDRVWPGCLKEDRVFMQAHTDGVQVFIKRIEDRINAYLDMRLELLKYLEEAGKKYPQAAEFIARLKAVMDRPVPVYNSYVAPTVRANGSVIVKPMVADFYKVLKTDTPDQLKKAEKGLGEGIPGKIGDPNDTRLRQLHRAVMVWRSMATMELARNPGPGATEIAKEVRKRTEETLRNPVGHEQVTVW